MKIVEDTISKTFIYQNDDNNICMIIIYALDINKSIL